MRVKKEKNGLHIVVGALPWKRLRGLQPLLERAAGVTVENMPKNLRPAARRAEYTLLLTTDAAVKTLNHDYRGLNRPTNVLSFPQMTRAGLIRAAKKKTPPYAGDIAVAYAYTVREAQREGKNPVHHVAHLLIHGLLHLFGYDHISDGTAARMERLETTLMIKLGLSDPYAPAIAMKTRRHGTKRKPV